MNRPELSQRGRGTAGIGRKGRLIVFTITVAGETYGIPIDAVRTVFSATSITPIPLAPRKVVGLINVRGHIVTALCMHLVLGRPHGSLVASVRENPLAVGVEHQGEDFALIVDDVGDVIELTAGQNIPIPPNFTPARRTITASVFNLPAGILPVLDVAALVALDIGAPAAA